MGQYLFEEESKTLLGLAMLLHRELGCGFKEKVYQDAFEVLLRENHIPYEREKHISLIYHGVVLQHDFFYDFFCYDKIGVEVKANHQLSSYRQTPAWFTSQFWGIQFTIQILPQQIRLQE